jgi:glycosyltransferase involved in cell wall biosynthesis
MRILILNWRDPTHPWAGGAEVFLFEAARRWINWGHSVTWLCGRHESQPPNGQIEGINIMRQGGIFSAYPAAAFAYLSKMRGQFDVLLDSANGIPFFTPLFTTAPKVILVHHIHREVFFRELPWHLAHLGNTLERVGMPLAYRRIPFIAVSNSSQQALVDIGIPAEQISVIHNGVDKLRFRPGDKSKTPLIVFVGRLRRYKSVDIAIRAMPELLRLVPQARLEIAGSGPMESSLRDLVDELGLSRKVVFHGFLTEEAKVELIQKAHVAVNPSLKEGWGLTVIEANACGTPVVAARVPGLQDSVLDGKTGVLVPYGDPTALASQVGKLLQDDVRRNQMAQEAINWSAGFDWDQTARHCLDLFAQCVATFPHQANQRLSFKVKELDRYEK